jgi:hypothetical protein
MNNHEDIVGKKFTRLTVLNLLPREKGVRLKARCQCDCGNICVKKVMDLISGSTKSCKCLLSETSSKHIKLNAHRFKNNSEHKIKHGDCNTSEYKIYGGIKTRCLNTNAPAYKYYGGRGIKMCDRWLGDNGYANFIEDMGRRPSEKYSVDRVDVNGDYEPGNCRWATTNEQAKNKRKRFGVDEIFDFLDKNGYLLGDRKTIQNKLYETIKKPDTMA